MNTTAKNNTRAGGRFTPAFVLNLLGACLVAAGATYGLRPLLPEKTLIELFGSLLLVLVIPGEMWIQSQRDTHRALSFPLKALPCAAVLFFVGGPLGAVLVAAFAMSMVLYDKRLAARRLGVQG